MKIRLLLVALACTLIIGVGAYAVYGDGDFDLTNDPLISLSYLNEVFWPKVEEAIAEASGGFADNNDRNEDTDTSEESDEETDAEDTSDAVDVIPEAPAFEYEVLHLIKGDIVLAETACELILRSGSASAYLSGNESGIADLTDGSELFEGDALSANHLMLIPRGGDGRGFLVTSEEIYIMVRGGYSIVAE